MKLTPEFEAKRILGVQRALKGKPATEAQRTARHQGILKAIKEGRYNPSRPMSEENKRKQSERQRGVPRPQWVIEKMRRGMIGRKVSPAQRIKMSERMREHIRKNGANPKSLEAFEKWRHTPEFQEHTRKLLNDPEREARRLSALRGIKWPKEIIENRVKPMIGRPHKIPYMAKGPSNQQAIEGFLRSPTNKIYHFKNLTHFVRSYPELFLPNDVIWVASDPKHPRSLRCRASKGLLGLFGHCKKINGSWKGWTKVSYYEGMKMGFVDPVNRESLGDCKNPNR